MTLSREHTGSKISAKVEIYILTRAELLCSLCYEIPCSSSSSSGGVRVVGGVKGVIPHYFVGRQCPICLERAQTIQDSSPICSDCEQDPNQVAKRLSQWICIWDTRIRYRS